MKDRNLLLECNEQKLVNENQFRQMFCRRCRNPHCVLAEGGENLWFSRISTQEDRLLTNPQFAQESDPRFEQIRAQHFEEMLERAYQMEIADLRQNWEIPEVTSRKETTQKVDQAVKRLAESQGKTPPHLPEPQEEGYGSPSQVGSDSGEPDPVQESQPDPLPSLQGIPINTYVPPQGIMVDGSDPHPPLPPNVIKDSWEIPVEKKIPVGGRIVLSVPPDPEQD